MMYKNQNNESGFSLVETLVAITILLIVIVGPITLIANSARSTAFANDQVIAFFLAQEGLEIIQAGLNDFQIDGFSSSAPAETAWERFTDTNGLFEHCLNSVCGLELQTNSDGAVSVTDCSTDSTACLLRYDDAEHVRARYTHDSDSGANEPTKFTRVITMNDIGSGQVEVVSTVTWRSDGQRAEQEIEAITYLFDIYGR